MLSLFPSLLSWGELAPFLIRITLGVVLVYWAYDAFHNSLSGTEHKVFGAIEGIAGILFLIGLWTQLVAIVISLYLIYLLIDKARSRSFMTDGINYYFILLVMSLSLIVSGAGFFAFDLPL